MNSVKLVFILVVGLALFSFNGCDSKKKSNEVQEVHWDRDMCERCKMVVSDRHHAVQIINPKTHKSYMHDDIGCAVLWFKEENIPWENEAVIWITDGKTGKWIDAKKAYYDTGNITPMAFGFAPHLHKEDIEEGKEVLNYEQVSQKIVEIKKKKMREKMHKMEMMKKKPMQGGMH